MKLSKAQFVRVIWAIKEQEELDSSIGYHLDEVVKSGANLSLVFTTPLIDSIVKAIDVDGIISWWMWDGPRFGEKSETYKINGVALHDAGELYDYIEKHYQS